MARLKLINLHTTGTSATNGVLTTTNPLELGEIAVQHNESDARLYIRLSDATNGTVKNTLASFIAESAIDTKISTAIAGVNSDVSDLNDKIGSGFSSTNTVAKAIADEASARTDADSELQAAISSAWTEIQAVASNLSDEIDNRADGDTTLGGRITTLEGKASDAETNISDLQSAVEANENAITAETEARQTAVSNEATARTEADTALGNRITAVENDLSTGATKQAIAAVSSATQTNAGNISNNATAISDLNDKLGTGFSASSTVANQLAGVKSTADSALQSISTGTADNYMTVAVGEKDANNNQTVAVSAKTKAISAVTSGETFLADAYDVKQEINKVSGGASDRLNTLESEVDVLQDQLNGFGTTQGAVKDYVDDQIAEAITSVYKVKGSVATYAQLPSSDLVEGDVYNVQGQTTIDGSVYPAGTNFVWVVDGENSGHWDALGGTVDLAPYMMTSAFTSWTSTTYTNDKNSITTDISDLSSATQTNAGAIADEVTARTSADTALGNRVTALENDLSTGATHQALVANENAITAETQARITAVSGVNSTCATLRTDLDSATAATQTVANNLADEITARTEADEALEERIEAIEESIGEGGSVADQLAALSSAITAEETARIAGDTALTQTTTGLRTDLDSLTDNVGTGFTSSNTVASQLAAVKANADTAVQTITVDNTATNGITATKTGTGVALNFDEMVIDCGTY